MNCKFCNEAMVGDEQYFECEHKINNWTITYAVSNTLENKRYVPYSEELRFNKLDFFGCTNLVARNFYNDPECQIISFYGESYEKCIMFDFPIELKLDPEIMIAKIKTLMLLR